MDNIGTRFEPVPAQRFDGGQTLLRTAAQPVFGILVLVVEGQTFDDLFHADILPPIRPVNLAAYGFGISRNHPFIDCNRRTAFVCVELFLALNGHALDAADVDCVLTMLAVAAGEFDEAAFADWLRRHMTKR